MATFIRCSLGGGPRTGLRRAPDALAIPRWSARGPGLKLPFHRRNDVLNPSRRRMHARLLARRSARRARRWLVGFHRRQISGRRGPSADAHRASRRRSPPLYSLAVCLTWSGPRRDGENGHQRGSDHGCSHDADSPLGSGKEEMLRVLSWFDRDHKKGGRKAALSNRSCSMSG